MPLVFTLLKLLVIIHLGSANVIQDNRSKLVQGNGQTRDILLGEDPDFECPGYGAWPHPERCELYYTCYLGEPTYVWQCRQDYLFDLTYYGCNFPELTDCGDRYRPGQSSTVPQTTTVVPIPTDPTFTCPEDNGFFPAEPDVCQSAYYVCVSDVAYVQKCPGNSIFDPNLLTCVPPDFGTCGLTTTPQTTTVTVATTSTTTEGPFVCPGANGVFPIRPEACTPYYYRCTNGDPYPTVCPDGQLFDPSQSLCVPSDVAVCNTAFTCPTSSGFYPYGDCSEKYYVCVDSKPYEAVCPEGSIFDPDRGLCAPKDQVPCYSSSTTSSSKPSTTTITQPPNPGGNYTCPEEDGSYPDPADCHKFYVCVYGTPYQKVCPGDLYYNPELQVCDYQQNVPSCVNGVPQEDSASGQRSASKRRNMRRSFKDQKMP